MFKSSALFALALAGLSAIQIEAQRTFTIKNNCAYTVWPAVYTGDTANGKPGGAAANGGWQLNPGQSSSIPVPENWTAGRFWGRQGCDFSKPDTSSCETASCIGGEQCTQPGIPPATLAEFTLSQSGQDNYDISNVDGSNIPVAITANGCPEASCSVNLNTKCPAELQDKDSSGQVVGCLSACQVTHADNDCCTGPDDTPQTCPSSGVQYYSYFHDNCPNSYAYAYDDANGLKTCSGAPDYTITFCP